jgi:hypothetical protein
MKNAARALGWATKALWILLIAFSTTAAYSAITLRIGFGEPQTTYSEDATITSLPFLINNTGFYDITDLNFTTVIKDAEGKAISTSTTFAPLIASGGNIEVVHNISLSVNDLNLTVFAFEDTIFETDNSVRLKFANAVPIQMSTNGSMDWRAPLHSFSIGEISYSFNGTHLIGTATLSFENHSPFLNVTGTIRYELYNNQGEYLGFGQTNVDVTPYSSYQGQSEIVVDNPAKLTPSGEIHVYFDMTLFSFGPVVMLYG